MVTEARPLQGSLDEFGLIEILQMMGLGNMTGALHLHRADGRVGIIYVYDGMLATCTEINTDALTLGHVLQQLGMANDAQLNYAYEIQTQNPLGKRIGQLLIDYKVITPEQLNDALRTQVLWTVRELAQWKEGEYEFLPGEHLSEEKTIPLRIEVTSALMEVLRFTQEWEELQPYLPDGMRTRLEMAYDIPRGPLLRFDVNTWIAISRVNRYRTIRNVASAIQQPELEVARVLAPQVERALLVPVESGSQPGLPMPAQRLSMESFDLFSLLSRIEQEWLRHRQPVEQLPAFATFINWTMRSLAETCEQNGIKLSSDALAILLTSANLMHIGDYRLQIKDNQIDIDDFTQLCRHRLNPRSGNVGAASAFYDRASYVLQQGLRAAFQAINARIASPVDRLQNQETWEALFLGFQGEHPPH